MQRIREARPAGLSLLGEGELPLESPNVSSSHCVFLPFVQISRVIQVSTRVLLSALETEHLGQGETSARLSVEIVRATRERDSFSSDGFCSGELTAPGMDDCADWAPQHVRVEVVGGGVLLGDGGPVERFIELPDFDKCLG